MAKKIVNLHNPIYVHIDGDGIGDRLELLLLDNKISEAVRYSEQVNQAMQEIRNSMESSGDASVLFAGGDHVFAVFSKDSWEVERIKALKDHFFKKTGSSFSCGVGISAQVALNNLRRAKLSGKNQIVSGSNGFCGC